MFERALARDTQARYSDVGLFWADLKAAASKPREAGADWTDVHRPAAELGAHARPPLVAGESLVQEHDAAAFGHAEADARDDRAAPVDSPRGGASFGARAASSGVQPRARRRGTAVAPMPMVRPMPEPSVQMPPLEDAPPPAPPKRGRGVMVALLIFFVVLSLGGSGLLLFALMRS